MEIPFEKGKFVSAEDGFGYQEVLDDFPTAETIRILTYNISSYGNKILLEKLKTVNAEIKFITNIPSRWANYRSTEDGDRARYRINLYLKNLNPKNFSERFSVYFCVENHAKIIGTENVVYIGSQNYSDESGGNIEAGVIIRDRDFIQKLYSDFFENVIENSFSYASGAFREVQDAFLNCREQFRQDLPEILEKLDEWNAGMTEDGPVTSIKIDKQVLDKLYIDILDLEEIPDILDNVFEERSEACNAMLKALKEKLDSAPFQSIKKNLSKGGAIYDFVTFDKNERFEYYWNHSYADKGDGDDTDKYTSAAYEDVREEFEDRRRNFEMEQGNFRKEINQVLKILDLAEWLIRWRARANVDPRIDNTRGAL